jgi:hypothetical protein
LLFPEWLYYIIKEIDIRKVNVNWKIFFNKEENILLVKVLGNVESLDLEKMIAEAHASVVENNAILCFVDCTEITRQLDNIDNYFLVHKFQELNVNRTSHIAIVYQTVRAGGFNFFETVCSNSGFQLKVFPNAEEGAKWLGCSPDILEKAFNK